VLPRCTKSTKFLKIFERDSLKILGHCHHPIFINYYGKFCLKYFIFVLNFFFVRRISESDLNITALILVLFGHTIGGDKIDSISGLL